MTQSGAWDRSLPKRVGKIARCASILTIPPQCEKLRVPGVHGVGGRLDSTISSLIGAAERGDGAAAEALFSALYSELHRLAKRELARQGVAVSLGATTLLHEAYLDMAARDGPSFPDRARFMGYAARVMRGLIIDHAREPACPEAWWANSRLLRSAPKPWRMPLDHRELARISEVLGRACQGGAASSPNSST